MIIIENVLISDDIISEHFVCNLAACKGACCKMGDYGAPLTQEEISQIELNLPSISKELPESLDLFSSRGFVGTYSEKQFPGTALHPDGSCVFLTLNESGINQCSIESSYNKGESTFKKPLSCELYPIRVTVNPNQGFEAWNYDRWDICSPACTNGRALKVPVYVFLKTAIIRAKGQAFYNQLHAAATHISNQ